MKLALLLMLSISYGYQSTSSQSDRSQAEPRTGGLATYDGNWWLAVDPDEQSGYLEGTADCLTWAAHKEGFSSTPAQLRDKISKYYKTNPAKKNVSVVEVWRRLTSSPGHKPNTKTEVHQQGETWSNPHWYLNGSWWQQAERAQRLGFLEGYLSCFHGYVKEPDTQYSRSADYYMTEISNYIRTHRDAYDQAIANILLEFKDQRVK
jgi:hypothetical protein